MGPEVKKKRKQVEFRDFHRIHFQFSVHHQRKHVCLPNTDTYNLVQSYSNVKLKIFT